MTMSILACNEVNSFWYVLFTNCPGFRPWRWWFRFLFCLYFREVCRVGLGKWTSLPCIAMLAPSFKAASYPVLYMAPEFDFRRLLTLSFSRQLPSVSCNVETHLLAILILIRVCLRFWVLLKNLFLLSAFLFFSFLVLPIESIRSSM